MLRIIIHRLFLAVPTLLIISWVLFGFSRLMPLQNEDINPEVRPQYRESALRIQEQDSRNACNKLRLHLPPFYFSLSTAALPDTLHKIFPPARREMLRHIALSTGNWPLTSAFDRSFRQLALAELMTPHDSLHEIIRAIKIATTSDELAAQAQSLAHIGIADSSLQRAAAHTREAISHLHTQQTQEQRRVPRLHWYGTENQYHLWFKGIFTGDMGYDVKGFPISQNILPSLSITLVISGLSLFFAYLIAVPLGVFMARRKGSAKDVWLQRILLLIYAMPSVGLGVLLLYIFDSPSNVSMQDNTPIFLWLLSNLKSIALPILALTLHSLTVLAFQMRGGILGVMNEDYIRTARAKGLSEQRVYWHHAFRNALFPIITVFASALPAVFMGALVIEYLFNLPGMGSKVKDAIAESNYPLIFALLMFGALMTILGNLIADLLYAWADPRVRYRDDQRKQSN